MIEREEKILPKEGEFWQRSYDGTKEMDTGIVYLDPDGSGKLMFASSHWIPCRVTSEMIHGKNGWNRIVPSVKPLPCPVS